MQTEDDKEEHGEEEHHEAEVSEFQLKDAAEIVCVRMHVNEHPSSAKFILGVIKSPMVQSYALFCVSFRYTYFLTTSEQLILSYYDSTIFSYQL